MRFPTVTGQNLAGRTYRLPMDFEGRANLVLVVFKRYQQGQVDSWVPVVDELRKQYPAFQYYELPTIGRTYRYVRGFIDGGMRAGIPDPETRERTITLYLEKDAFRRRLAIADERMIHVLLVDGEGDVVWRTKGPRTPGGEESLRGAVDRLLSVRA